jgi:hypothetical protein
MLERLALIIQLSVVLVFAWVWSGVAAEIFCHKTLPWVVARLTCAVIVGLAAIYMLVWGVLGALALSDPHIPSGPDSSFFVGTFLQFMLCSALLVLCIFVLVKALQVEDQEVLLSLRFALVMQIVLWVAVILQLATGIQRTYFGIFSQTSTLTLSLLSEALLYGALIALFLSFFLRARTKYGSMLATAQDDLIGADEQRYDY